jgi:hypothetical protein
VATINDVLDEAVKQTLHEQVEHLRKLSEDPDRGFHVSDEWKLRYDGAKTIMDLIESDLGLGRNTGLGRVILNMNLEDLKRYRKEFDNRITEFESEPKVKIFGVRTGDVVMKWLLTKPEANEALKTMITEDLDDDDGDDENEYECEFGIMIMSVFQSEVKEYVRQ